MVFSTFLCRAFTAHCLYTLRDYSILTCRFHGTGYLSAKHHVLGACFSLMAPFRTRFSPCEVARTADVQKLIGCLYTLRDYSILTCRFHGTGHLSAKHGFSDTCLLLTAPFRSMLLTLRGGP